MTPWIEEELFRSLDRLERLKDSGLISSSDWLRMSKVSEDLAEIKQREHNRAVDWFYNEQH